MDKFRNRYRIPSARLASWDYGSSGLYFVTIDTKARQPFFGRITLDEEGQPVLHLTDAGLIAKSCWNKIPEHFSFVELDAFTLMPDHLHGIICFNKQGEREWQVNKVGPQKDTLGVVLGSFKSAVTYEARKKCPEFGWQSRFWDHIIRSQEELGRIRLYIDNNVRKRWDKFGPS
jgi:REP element-mobilizing transposase RayT